MAFGFQHALRAQVEVVQVSGCSVCDCEQSQGLCHTARARVTMNYGDTHNLLLPPSPPTTVPQSKQMSKLVSSIQTKQSPVLSLGTKVIVLRCFLQCRGRIKEEK